MQFIRFNAAVAAGSTDCGDAVGVPAVADGAAGSGFAAAAGVSSFLEQALTASNIANINGNLTKAGCEVDFIFRVVFMVKPFSGVYRQKKPATAGFS